MSWVFALVNETQTCIFIIYCCSLQMWRQPVGDGNIMMMMVVGGGGGVFVHVAYLIPFLN